MPFGKHKGRLISEIPRDYLRWLLDNVRDLEPYLRQQVLEALGYRQSQQAAPRPSQPVLDARTVIDRWYREMTLKFHPDRFGSHEAMVAINHAHERLRQLAGVT
jgi:hypothetical protein